VHYSCSTMPSTNTLGLPRPLFWGYVGIVILMMGDGVEQGWLSPYLLDHSMSIQQSASLSTAYGTTIALQSWFSATLAKTYTPRFTMALGLILCSGGTGGFVGIGINQLNYPVMLFTYAIRGFGYPLFAYSILVWITYRTEKNELGKAVGWFWFVFTGGLNV